MRKRIHALVDALPEGKLRAVYLFLYALTH